jgi:hypothetical protein
VRASFNRHVQGLWAVAVINAASAALNGPIFGIRGNFDPRDRL